MNRLVCTVLIVLLSTLLVSNSLAHHSSEHEDVEIETFEQFKEHFHKQYKGEKEEEFARLNFEKSKQWIAENQDLLGFKVGITLMADEPMTNDEDSNQKNGFFSIHNHDHHDHTHPEVNLPEHFDWREKIPMSRVISQGKCGSCWAFASAVMIEMNLAIHHNITAVLSVQELIDCTKTVAIGNLKCHGGHAYQGWKYVQKYGIHLEQHFPLVNHDNDTHDVPCRKNVPGYKYHIGGYHALKGKSKDHEIQETIMKHGPVTALVIGTNNEFRYYKGGVMKDLQKNPSSSKLNHEIIIVGWGHDPVENMDYWVIRNSWGTYWGERGYGRIQRGINSLGINDAINYLD